MKISPLARKTALVALLLAAALFLSGCNLVKKDPAVDAQQVILSINGETVNKETFTRYYDNAYNRALEEQALYQQYGLPSAPINPTQLLQQTLDNTAKDIMLHQKAHDLGLDELTPEETAKVEADAAKQFEDIKQQVKDYYFPATTLEGEELAKAIDEKTAELGITLDLYIQSAKESDLHEKLHSYAGREITITDEQVEADFNAKVEQAKTDYTADPSLYGTALTSGQPVYYAPAGYRTVRQILIQLNPEDKARLTTLENELNPLKTALDNAQSAVNRYEAALASEGVSEEDKAFVSGQHAALGGETARLEELLKLEGIPAAEAEEIKALQAKLPVYTDLEAARTVYQPKLDALNAARVEAFAAIQEKTNEVYQLAIAEGADFEALVKEHDQDPGQPAEGYTVSAATTAFVPEFTAAAMALEKVGDISQPVQTSYGNHILRYQSDIPEGPVALDSVKETLREELFNAAEEARYHELEESWLAEADIQQYPERFRD